ncbi:MAG: glycoside hydrolase family 5 protein, partial [Chloroflexi bacterium]|nr:glycoside hydrolase family 5 protein [Chloroflexota bacterium]
MQTLVDTIRGQGNPNLILADGLATGEDLNAVPNHLLHGGNVVYAVHPYFNATQHATAAEWDHWFGDAAATLPVVADEWGEYQSSSHGECFPQAPVLVPQFLAYLRRKQIGLIGYALYPGILIRGWNFADPTAFDYPPYTCPNTP